MPMTSIKFTSLPAIMLILLSLAGCTSSDKSATEQTTGAGGTGTGQNVTETKNRADSMATGSQAEYRLLPRPKVYGKYAVQIGAYTTLENAAKISDLAKERFNIIIYTYHDETDNLYKVFIGDFLMKDEARNYRDEMVRKFPGEYNDAWVSEHPPQ